MSKKEPFIEFLFDMNYHELPMNYHKLRVNFDSVDLEYIIYSSLTSSTFGSHSLNFFVVKELSSHLA